MEIKHLFAVNFLILALLLHNGFYKISTMADSLYIYSPENAVLTEDYDALRKISSEQFGISYYVKSYSNIENELRDRDCNIYGVNAQYLDYNNFILKEGSFITPVHEENVEKAAVLNLNAAFSLFGTTENLAGEYIKYEGNTYIICGIIDDREKTEENVYFPVTTVNKGIKELIAPLTDGISKEGILNTLENEGLLSAYKTEQTKHYTNLPSAIALFSVYTALVYLCAVIFTMLIINTAVDFKTLYSLRKDYYPMEMIKENKKLFLILFLKTAVLLLIIFLGSIALEKLVLLYLEYFDVLKAMVKNNFNTNNYKLQTFAGKTMYSYIYIILFLISLGATAFWSLYKIVTGNNFFHKS